MLIVAKVQVLARITAAIILMAFVKGRCCYLAAEKAIVVVVIKSAAIIAAVVTIAGADRYSKSCLAWTRLSCCLLESIERSHYS